MLHPRKLMYRSPDHYNILTWDQYRRLFSKCHPLRSAFLLRIRTSVSPALLNSYSKHTTCLHQMKTHHTKVNIKHNNTFRQQQQILLSCSSHQNPCILHIHFLECTMFHCTALWEELGNHYAVKLTQTCL